MKQELQHTSKQKQNSLQFFNDKSIQEQNLEMCL